MASNVTRTTRRDGIQFGANGYLSLADNEIDVSSGDLTLDVANNCIINADGGGLAFKDGSNLALTIVSRGDLTPTQSVLDKIEENSDEAPEIPENNN